MSSRVMRRVSPKFYEVRLTQFMRPNGTPVPVSTYLPVETQELYEEMSSAGAWFEAEELRTGQVSLTIATEDEDIDIEIVSNGPMVQKAMARMLKRKAWKKSESDGEENETSD